MEVGDSFAGTVDSAHCPLPHYQGNISIAKTINFPYLQCNPFRSTRKDFLIFFVIRENKLDGMTSTKNFLPYISILCVLQVATSYATTKKINGFPH